MKVTSLVTVALTLALPTFAQVVEYLTYAAEYDEAYMPLPGDACSDGLLNQGYTTFGSLPNFPNIGAFPVIGWEYSPCSTCYNVTYFNPATNTNTTIAILVVDSSSSGSIVVSEEAMNALTGGLAVEFGKVEVTVVQVDNSVCGL